MRRLRAWRTLSTTSTSATTTSTGTAGYASSLPPPTLVPNHTALVQRQILLERKSLDSAVRASGELHEVLKDTRILAERVLQGRLETQWKRALTEALSGEQARCLSHTPGTDRSIYGAYIVLLEPEVLAHITIREALAASLGPENGTPTVHLAMNLGRAVEHALAAALADSAKRGLSSAISRALERDRKDSSGLAGAKSWKQRGKKGGGAGGDGPSMGGASKNTPTDVVLAQTSEVDWPNVVRLKVGAVLLELLRRCALVHVDPATHRLMEEEGIYVAKSGGFSSSSGSSSGSGSDSEAGATSTSSPAQAASFPSVKEPVTPRESVVVRGGDDAAGEGGNSRAWLVGSALSKGNPLAAKASTPEPRLKEEDSDGSSSDGGGGLQGGGVFSYAERARRLGRAVAQPLISNMGGRGVREEGEGGSSSSSSSSSSIDSSKGGDIVGGEAWLGMRGTVLLDSGGVGGGGKKGGGVTKALRSEGATYKGLDLSELGTELDFAEFDSMVNQGVAFAKARKEVKAEREAVKASREAFSRSVDITSSVVVNGVGEGGGGSASPSSSSAAAGAEVPFHETTFSSSPTFSEDATTSSSTPGGGGGGGSGGNSRTSTTTSTTSTTAGIPPSEAASSASYVSRLAQSLSARVASLTPHKEVMLPDGRVVWAVPAFLHHYVFTRVTPDGQKRGLSRSSEGGGGEGVGREERGGKGSDGWTPSSPSARKARFVGLLFVHPRLTEILSVRAALLSEVVPGPMVVPPSPWKSFWGPGPYLTSRFPLMRTLPSHRAIVDAALKESLSGGGGRGRDRDASLTPSDYPFNNFGAVVDALNFLGSIPWVINARVLGTVRELWNDSGDPEGRGGRAPAPGAPSIPDVPPFESQDPPIPVSSRGGFTATTTPTPQAGDESGGSAAGSSATPPTPPPMSLKEISRIRMARANAHSLRCDFRLKLEVAKEHVNDRAIYFPHNMDFRGRVYPLPPHLNHMGSDLPRGLLLFERAVPLGESGLKWLQVHLANLMGRDKMSFADRVAWVEGNTGEIMATAVNPLKSTSGANGIPWWAGGDTPWQTLSVAQELAHIYSLPAHARPLHASRVPVHQDGSCNGLQHYAALGRDVEGAAAVNLLPAAPGEGPADVYTRVLSLVLQRIEEDAVLGCEATHATARLGAHPPPLKLFAQRQASALHSDPALMEATGPLRKMCALFLRGRVDRKVVKQTVMTTVYGVTFMGAREQVWNRLREKCTLDNTPTGMAFDAEDLDHLLQASSQYLARVTLNSLGTLFNNADAIKDWLTTVAKVVAARDQPISWITPLGIPCVQPYREGTRRQVLTVLQTMVVNDASDPTLPVSRSRQKSAFPPNFIHSLDSSHMFLTALACKQQGLDFAAVHDSYWTHPGHVGVMRELLRSEFVRLYSRPILEDFRDSLRDRMPGLDLPPVPPKGKLDLKEVLNSQFFFSEGGGGGGGEGSGWSGWVLGTFLLAFSTIKYLSRILLALLINNKKIRNNKKQGGGGRVQMHGLQAQSFLLLHRRGLLCIKWLYWRLLVVHGSSRVLERRGNWLLLLYPPCWYRGVGCSPTEPVYSQVQWRQYMGLKLLPKIPHKVVLLVEYDGGQGVGVAGLKEGKSLAQEPREFKDLLGIVPSQTVKDSPNKHKGGAHVEENLEVAQHPCKHLDVREGEL